MGVEDFHEYCIKTLGNIKVCSMMEGGSFNNCGSHVQYASGRLFLKGIRIQAYFSQQHLG